MADTSTATEDKKKLSRGSAVACFENFSLGGWSMLFASVSALVFIVGTAEINYYRAELSADTGIYQNVPGYGLREPLFDYKFQLGLQEFCTDLTIYGPLFPGSGRKTCRKIVPKDCFIQWSYVLEGPVPITIYENFTLFNNDQACSDYQNSAGLVIAALVFASLAATIQIWLSVKDSFNRLCIGFALLSLVLSFLLGVIGTGLGARFSDNVNAGPRLLGDHALLGINSQVALIYANSTNEIFYRNISRELFDSVGILPDPVYSQQNVHAKGCVIAGWILALIAFFLYAVDLWRVPPAVREAAYLKQLDDIQKASAGQH